MRPGFCWTCTTTLLLATTLAQAQVSPSAPGAGAGGTRSTPSATPSAAAQPAPSPAAPTQPGPSPVAPAAEAPTTEAPATAEPGEPGTELGPTNPSPSEDVPPDGAPAEIPEQPLAAAAPTPAPAPPAPIEAQPAPPAPFVPFAGDSLGGQFQVGLSGSFAVPFGELSRGADAHSQTGIGFSPALDLGFGVARHIVVGAYGQAALYGSTSECSDCSSTGVAAGAFVRYHLVQGLRFDPWVSYGLGYRSLARTSASDGNKDYAGLEWLRLQFGGDWYLNRQFGFGPLLELGATSYLSVPAAEDAGGINWRFQAGLRLLLDLPGR